MTAVSCRTVPISQITADLRDRWVLTQEHEAEFSSPFFRPEFALCIGRHFSGIEAAVLEDGPSRGFLSFVRSRSGFASSLPMCDYDGVVADRVLRWDADRLLRDLKLAAWDFSNLLASQLEGRPARVVSGHESPFADLSAGLAGFRSRVESRSPDRLRDIEYQERQLAKRFGEVRFTADEPDGAALLALLDWKAKKFGPRGGMPARIIASLQDMRAHRTAGFRGHLSALYAGDRLVAAHFGLSSGTVFHYWFPAYDESFATHSPGSILMWKLIQHAAASGFRRFDMGSGGEPYKLKWMNGVIAVAQGSFESGRPAVRLRSALRFAGHTARNCPPVVAAVRALKAVVRRAKP